VYCTPAQRIRILPLILGLSGCGDVEKAPTASNAETITVSPSFAEITVGQFVSVRCRSTTSGAELLCPSWSQGNPSVAFLTSFNSEVANILGTGEGTTSFTGTSEAGRTGSVTVKVHRLVVELTPSARTLQREQSVALTATLKDFAGASLPFSNFYRVRWEAIPSDGVSIAPSGPNNATATVIAKKVGQTIVTAKIEDAGDAYNKNFDPGGTATLTVVAGAAASATVTPSSTELSVDESAVLACGVLDSRGDPVTGANVTWVVENGSVVSVNATSGRVTGLTSGSATVTCFVSGTTITASTVVTVRPFVVTVSTAGGGPANVLVGSNLPLQAVITTFKGASVSSAGKTITWSSAAGTTVNAAGVVTGLPPGGGVSRVTATLMGPGSASGFLDVNVIGSGETVTVTGTTSMTVGNSVFLTVTFRDAAGTTITSPVLTFSNYDATALTVLSQGPNFGVIRALRAGTFPITVTATKAAQSASAIVNLTGVP
jgi:uncharacterized protein YjdB